MPPPAATPARAVVGIGASAGGLEALEKFLAQVPPDTGLAFVVIQHLDPTVEDLLPELLQRITEMPVLQARDQVPVSRNCVYVIPPNRDLALQGGMLRLSPPASARGLRLPIDFFFCSLAEEMHRHSIGVILSGMGSDGCQGLRAIKAQGGLGLAQEPAGARFSSMPQAAIDGGWVDLVAPAEELPRRMLAALRLDLEPDPQAATESEEQSLLRVARLLRARTGQEFSLYKRTTLVRRIERRMGVHRLASIQDYARFLGGNPHEVDLLFKELLIGVTSFFRDPALWALLREEVIPSWLAGRPAGKVFRAWVPACSTGEEAYGLAILFQEALARIQPRLDCSLQIFATDLDRDAIDRARRGAFKADIAADVSPERLGRFFLAEPDGFRVRPEIRKMVVFAQQNLIMDPPFTKLDLLSCRNLLIYLAPELQRKLLRMFHYSLLPGGILCLGTAESVGHLADQFPPWGGKQRLFRRGEARLSSATMIFPPALAVAHPGQPKESPMSETAPNLADLANQVLLQQFAPPAVVVNEAGDILYISGRTGKYLEPAAGKANWNLYAMARDGLRLELGNALHRAAHQSEPVTAHDLRLDTDGGTQLVGLTVQKLAEAGAPGGLILVVFRDQPALPPGPARDAPQAGGRVKQLQLELLHSRTALHNLHQEMQTSQEELKSANEELQSTNEELQSTNEELTTSKEELQSLNEELQTINAEQQSHMDELARTSSDMKNLLDSTNITTVFLDRDLRIGRFTAGASQLFQLLPGDVGRPLTDITTILDYGRMPADARTVLQTLAPLERTVTTRDRRWFSVRIMPYRTQDERIDGLVLTFTETTQAKLLEQDLRATAGQFQTLSDHLHAAYVQCAAITGPGGAPVDGRPLQSNQSFRRLLGSGLAGDGRTLLELLPALGNGLGAALADTPTTGEPRSFARYFQSGDISFNLTTYRPGPDQFVCIFEDSNESTPFIEASRDPSAGPAQA